MDYKTCPNCGKKIGGFLTANSIVEQDKIDFINEFNLPKSEAYCVDCSKQLIKNYTSTIVSRKNELKEYISDWVYKVPVITANNPHGWNYETLEMVSSQSVTGTGFASELSSSWSDFIGGQSDVLANKILYGERMCKNKLRYMCLSMGGNAIIATDIDYSEVGGAKGMLMVCMAGTAVKLDIGVGMYSDRKEILDNLAKMSIELTQLNSIKFPTD